MPSQTPTISAAFGRLRLALLRRRMRRLDAVLWLELGLLGVLAAALAGWQSRLALDACAHAGGAGRVAAQAALALAAFVTVGGILAGADLRRRLRGVPAGPEWLGLPLRPSAILGQITWESGLHAFWVVPPGLGVLGSTIGLMPAWGIVLLGTGFLAALLPAGKAGGTIASRILAWSLPRGRAGDAGRHPVERLLASARHSQPGRFASPGWKDGTTRALLRTDLARSLRRTAARAHAVPWLVLLLLATAVWALPAEPSAAGSLSVALLLLGATELAAWMVRLSSGDPYSLLAPLPLRARRVWGVRVGMVAAAAVVTALLLGIAARSLGPTARSQMAAAMAVATLLIGALGVTYGVTLYPRVEVAQRLVLLWFVLALVASAMLPLAGWIVLAGALLHSLRRLSTRITLAADVVAGEL